MTAIPDNQRPDNWSSIVYRFQNHSNPLLKLRFLFPMITLILSCYLHVQLARSFLHLDMLTKMQEFLPFVLHVPFF